MILDYCKSWKRQIKKSEEAARGGDILLGACEILHPGPGRKFVFQSQSPPFREIWYEWQHLHVSTKSSYL
jgi:hypothetical protein